MACCPRESGPIKKLPEGKIKGATEHAEKLKASIRANVEHPFDIVKNLFGHRKTRYRGIAKNDHQLRVLFALANIYMTLKALLARYVA